MSTVKISSKRINQRINSKLFAIKGPVRFTSGDWFNCLLTLPTSRILNRTKYFLLTQAAWTAIIVILFRNNIFAPVFPTTVHSILGSALALLLVFRTNSSYDRFWEARKQWTSILASGRDLARLTMIHVQKSYHERIAKLIIAFAIIVKQHLQGGTDQSLKRL